jgi:hypothetical protein
MLIRRNVQPKIISERLGHSSIKITMDLYGYLMPGLQDSVAELLNSEDPNQEKPTQTNGKQEDSQSSIQNTDIVQ